MHGLVPGRDPRNPERTRSGVRSLSRALDLLGDRWTLLIVYEAMFAGTTRFGDFQRALRIPTNVLTRRLQTMVEAGVLERVPAPRGHSPHEYRLTAYGDRLLPVVAALLTWDGERPAAEIAEIQQLPESG
jgi:DNA-binding HxlR family transcriptional regulator